MNLVLSWMVDEKRRGVMVSADKPDQCLLDDLLQQLARYGLVQTGSSFEVSCKQRKWTVRGKVEWSRIKAEKGAVL